MGAISQQASTTFNPGVGPMSQLGESVYFKPLATIIGSGMGKLYSADRFGFFWELMWTLGDYSLFLETLATKMIWVR